MVEEDQCLVGIRISDICDDARGLMDRSQRVGQHAERKQKGEADQREHGVKSVKEGQSSTGSGVKDSHPSAMVINDKAADDEADWSAVMASQPPGH